MYGIMIKYLFYWHMLDESTDDSSWFLLSNVNLLHVQRIRIRMLLYVNDFAHPHIQT